MTTPTWEIGMRNELGWTLLEMMVVLSVLSLSAGLIAGAGRHLPVEQQRQAAVVGFLQQAQQRAVASGTAVGVRVEDERLFLSAGKLDTPSVRLPGMHLQWFAPRHPSSAGPMFYPDGSATPGQLRDTADAGRFQISIGWTGELSDGAPHD